MPELKPCPFCGGAAEYLPAGCVGDSDEVVCRPCGVSIGFHHDDAIAAWNRRATPPAAAIQEADIPDYDAGVLNDFGGGNIDWWQDYIRAEIRRANDYWRDLLRSLEAA